MSDSCDLVDCTLPGSSVHETSQARTLEWVAISFSRESSQPSDHTPVLALAGTEPPGKPVIIGIMKKAILPITFNFSFLQFLLCLLHYIM